MAVGCTTGLVAFTLDVLGSKLLALKFALSARAMAPTSGDVASAWFRAFFTHTVLSLALVAVAAILVIWVAPIAGGSGIPEVKAYLQGIKVCSPNCAWSLGACVAVLSMRRSTAGTFQYAKEKRKSRAQGAVRL
eukprot:5952533-Pleurochrysis_carterae.AAC.3